MTIINDPLLAVMTNDVSNKQKNCKVLNDLTLCRYCYYYHHNKQYACICKQLSPVAGGGHV